MIKEDIVSIIGCLEQSKAIYNEIKEIFLANLVMISEIPAPTFSEQERVSFILDRLSDLNLINTSTDEFGNALGIIPGKDDSKNILITSRLDSAFDIKVDHSVSVSSKTVSGAAVADNTVGLAALMLIPMFFEKLDIKLDSNLILMGAAQSLGKGSLAGLRFFLSNFKQPIKAGISIEGNNLGDFSHRSIGMLRCEVIYSTPENFDWQKHGRTGAIETLNEIISRMREIPLPSKPNTTICFSSLECGSEFDVVAAEGVLRFEVRSESEDMVNSLKYQIQDIVAEVSSNYGIPVEMHTIGKRKPGGIPFTHPLTTSIKKIMEIQGIRYSVIPSTSGLSAFIDNNIPALALPLTNIVEKDKNITDVELAPLASGLKILLGLILSIDKDDYNES